MLGFDKDLSNFYFGTIIDFEVWRGFKILGWEREW